MSDSTKVSNTPQSSLSYKDAGVDIDAGNELVNRIKSIAKATRRPEVLGGLGGFGALCELPAGYKEPVLVSDTDGVGTKLRLAMDLKQHEGIGIDLVAMCVNDLIVAGAEPLFFLDYYATGKLNIDVAATVVESIGKGCQLAGCSLVGGETAEMPGMYEGEDYDLAGFCVGVVEKSRLLEAGKVNAGDVLIGLGSSGPHSNGYSLIRKILDVSQTSLHTTSLDNTPLAELLLAPTRIYVKSVLQLMKEVDIHGLAHITGGGLPENLPRILPDNTSAHIDTASWEWPPVFKWLQAKGAVETFEMYRTFNCGVGMVLCIAADDAATCIEKLRSWGEQAWIIGHVSGNRDDNSSNPPSVVLEGVSH